MKKRVYTEVVVDDRTGKEIPHGGWEIRGLPDGWRVYHFRSLSSFAVAVLDRPEIFGVSQENLAHFMDLERRS